MVDAASTEESSAPVESEGWSFASGMVNTPKVGSDKAGPVRAHVSREATEGFGNWMGATLGALPGLIVW